MSFNYSANLNAVVTCLENANTTTAATGGTDLSGSMTTRVQTILNDDPRVSGIRMDKFPALFVTIAQSIDAESAMAGGVNSRRKNKTVTYEVTGLYRKDGYGKSHADTLPDFYQLAANLEGVIKRNLTFSGTALMVSDVTTNFQTERVEQGWIKVFRTNFNVLYQYQ